MPIPLLFIAIAAGTGSFGVGKSIQAYFDNKTANSVTESAYHILECAKYDLDKARRDSSASLAALGRKKAELLSGNVSRFVELFEKIKKVDFRKTDGLYELAKFNMDKISINELKEMGHFATSLMGGLTSGAVGGALTAYGAYSAAGWLASASTGTLIADLYGAAATNATLAFFGGGSLATGGLGIFGGTAVLGGLVAGPGLAILGLIVGAKASKAKDDAYTNLAQAEKYSDELALAASVCRSISRRSDMFSKLLEDLNERFDPLIKAMDNIIRKCGTDFSTYSQDAKNTMAASASIAGTIKAVIDTPILTKEGKLTPESQAIYRNVKRTYFPLRKESIIEIFAKEGRFGFTGKLTWDEISECSKSCGLSDNDYIVYANINHRNGTSYFVVTTDAIVYSHDIGYTIDSKYNIPFESVIDVQTLKENNMNGIHVLYMEDGKEKGLLFLPDEVGDGISYSEYNANHFVSLLQQIICL